jgi:curli biogenesis system outer membrane secretion channel CsgG
MNAAPARPRRAISPGAALCALVASLTFALGFPSAALAQQEPKAAPAAAASDKKPGEITVATVDFDNVSGQNLPGIGRVAHDVINTYLVGLPGVSVVTRDKLASVLKEKELAASGLVGDRAKSTQLAGLLGADYMVTGSVLQYATEQRRFANFGVNTLTIFHRMKVSLQVVDLGSAKMSFAKTYDLEFRDTSGQGNYAGGYYLSGRERDLLDGLVQQASADLQKAVVARTGAGGAGKLVKIPVTSTPPGADIEVNGLYVGSTPADIELEEGVQSLKVNLSGYRPWERKVKVSADLKVAAALAPLPDEQKITIEQKKSK